MTLKIYSDLDQRTEDWYAARRGIVTASAVGKLITVRKLGAIDHDCPACGALANGPCRSKVKKAGEEAAAIKTLHTERTAVADARRDESPPVYEVADTEESRRLTANLVAERINGFTDPTFISTDMWRGIDDEPHAVQCYSEHYGEVTTVGFMVDDRWGFPIGFSPDGLVGDDGLIEVKSRRSGTQLLTVISDGVPAFNMAQVQCGLLVSGRKWLDYVSYAGGMHLWTKRVYPDPLWHAAIIAAVAAFEERAEQMVTKYTEAVAGRPMTERIEYADLEVVI